MIIKCYAILAALALVRWGRSGISCIILYQRNEQVNTRESIQHKCKGPRLMGLTMHLLPFLGSLTIDPAASDHLDGK